MVLGAACLGEEPLSKFLQVAAVVHLNLSLLPEEVLQVLKQLHPQLTLLVQTLELFYQLGTDLCQGEEKKIGERNTLSECDLFVHFFMVIMLQMYGHH